MTTTIPKPCQQRHHNYGDDGLCAGCGKKRGTREARALGAGGAGALRAALGLNDALHQKKDPADGAPDGGSGEGKAVQADALPPALPSPPPEKPRPSARLWPRVAKRLTQAFDAATDAAVERSGYQPNAAEDEDLQDFEGALAEQLGVWFPDVAAGPKARMGLAAFFVVMEKRWNAEKIAKPAGPVKLTSVPPAGEPPPPTSVPPTEPQQPAQSESAAPVAATESELTLLRDL